MQHTLYLTDYKLYRLDTGLRDRIQEQEQPTSVKGIVHFEINF